MQAIELDPGRADNYSWRAQSYYAAGYSEKALNDIRLALKLNADDEMARYLLDEIR